MVEDQAPEQKEKKPFLSERTKNILKAIYLVIMIGYSCYSVYAAIAAFTKFDKITGQFLGLLDNWKYDMIKEIVTVDPTAECPTGYAPLLKYKWHGTMDGCNCKNITTTYDATANVTLKNVIYKNKCNSTQTGLGCSMIAPLAAKDLTVYRGYKYCAERIKGSSFLETAEKMKEDGTCMDGFMKCGGKDNSMNAICADKTKFNNICPVMDITDNPPGTNGYVRVNLSHLYITRHADFGNSSISEIHGNDGGICLKSAKETTTTLTNHELMNKNLTRCTEFDNSYKAFGAGQPLRDLFTTNGVFVSVVPELETHITNAQNFIPFKKDYIGFKTTCRDEVRVMVNSEGEVKSIRGAQTGLLAIAIIVGFILGVVYIILELIVMFGCGCQPERIAKMKNCLECRIYANPLLKILHIIFLAWAVAVSGRVRNYFTNLAVQNCGDAGTNNNLNDLSSQINKFVYEQNRNSLIVTCVMILLDIVTLIFKKCCDKKKNDNDSVHQIQPTVKESS